MTSRYLLLTVFIQLHLFQVKTLILPKNFLSRQFDLTKFIEFPCKQECLQVALNAKQQPQLSLVASANNVPIYIWSHTFLQHRDISTEREGQCETFLIFAESIEIVKSIFIPDQSSRKQFFPFSKIYFHLDNRHNYSTDLESMSLAREFLIENALFGYVFEYDDKDIELRVIIRDLLTNEVKTTTASYTPNYLVHPMVDTNLVKDNFRISLFNCTPYTIYTQDTQDDTY